LKPLGVGLVFTPELLPLFRAGNEAVSILEVEPQTLWQLSRAHCRETYRLNRERLAELVDLPQRKLLHSVGLPVGGSQPLEPEQIDLLRIMAGSLEPAWVSEHLSFNAFYGEGGWTSAGFLLPPLQCTEAVAGAGRKLRALAQALERPVAFETGVNYLAPQANELRDGEFFRAVAEAAHCGILLDLHNLWTNERNGRQRVEDVLSQLPLECVWEVHLAGGMELDGYWLDAHSGAVPEPVLELAAGWIPRMPNLGALIFEILDDHVAGLGLDGIAKQLEAMHSLWKRRPSKRTVTLNMPSGSRAREDLRYTGDLVKRWEDTLGGLVIGRERDGEFATRLRADAGLEVLRKLVADSRAGFVTQGLQHTTTLLLASLGAAEVHTLLSEFARSCPPELFVSAEADRFASFLEAKHLPIPYLSEVIAFEHALIRAVLYGEGSTVVFEHEPTALLESLEQGRIPRDLGRQTVPLVVRPG
jgi:uncharacterized protein (UPF0276 family)